MYAYRYGHQSWNWDERATIDRLRGIVELLKLSSAKGLAKLHKHVLFQLEMEKIDVLSHADNMQVMSWLIKANGSIDCDLLRKEDPRFDRDYYVIEPLDVLCDGYRKYNKIRSNPLMKPLVAAARKLRD